MAGGAIAGAVRQFGHDIKEKEKFPAFLKRELLAPFAYACAGTKTLEDSKKNNIHIWLGRYAGKMAYLPNL